MAAPPGAEPARQGEAVLERVSGLTPRSTSPLGAEATRLLPDLDDPDPGARVLQIDRVEIRGREQVSERQIRSILRAESLVQGSRILWPEDERVDRARERLRATGYFKRVILRLEPVAETKDRVVLVVDLAERGTVAIDGLYLGSSRLTPFRGGVSVAERNFLGRGIRIGGALVWGTLPNLEQGRRQQSYTVYAEAPRLGNAKLGMLGSAYSISASEPYRVSGREDDPDPRAFRALDYVRIGGLLGLTFPLARRLQLGFDYRFERVDARVPTHAAYVDPHGERVPLDLALRRGPHRLTAAHLGVVWDGREDRFLAGKGGRFALDLQLSSPAIGSEYEYLKLVAAAAYSLRLPWKHWLTPQVSAGQIAGQAPRFELFYAGDLSDWTPGREQGLIYSTRNPVDVFGTGIDTRTLGVMFGRIDLEYVWPLFRRTRTRGVFGADAFLSAGIYTLIEDRATRTRRQSHHENVAPLGFNADFGVRLDTAAGTISISIGNVLRRTPL